MPTQCPRHNRGSSLPELLVVLLILGVIAAASVPAFGEISAQFSLQAAATHVSTIFNEARLRATYQGVDVGVKWVALAGDIVLSIHEDGNGNGVTTEDIQSGRDRLISGPISMRGRYPHIDFRFLKDLRGSDPGGNPLGNLDDPIRFGRSDICTFAPTGRSSPGSVYLSDGWKRQAVVRISPATSKIQIYEWRPGTRNWLKRL